MTDRLSDEEKVTDERSLFIQDASCMYNPQSYSTTEKEARTRIPRLF
jgi:hypothetical protein